MERTERARLRAGDAAAFGELFDAHAQTIYRYAARSTGDLNAAEDVVSLTFLEAWRLRGRLESGDASVLPWLFGITTNVLRNQARAKRRHQAAMSRMPPREQPHDFTDEVIGRMADAEQVKAARAALDELSDADREVITLCVWSGLDYTAAAEALGVPVGTVRSRLSRARTKLRELTTTTMRRGNR
jgi:RNA polymerase sigma-70 factor (ECF subfamily)